MLCCVMLFLGCLWCVVRSSTFIYELFAIISHNSFIIYTILYCVSTCIYVVRKTSWWSAMMVFKVEVKVTLPYFSFVTITISQNHNAMSLTSPTGNSHDHDPSRSKIAQARNSNEKLSHKRNKPNCANHNNCANRKYFNSKP